MHFQCHKIGVLVGSRFAIDQIESRRRGLLRSRQHAAEACQRRREEDGVQDGKSAQTLSFAAAEPTSSTDGRANAVNKPSMPNSSKGVLDGFDLAQFAREFPCLI
jgi:hypothetical protein